MRYNTLDVLRGVVLIGMIFFHINYVGDNLFDTVIFHFSDTFWFIFGKIVGILYISIAGFSFFLSTEQKSTLQIINNVTKRFFLLALIASIISVITYIFFYEQRISFGIIHFFAFVSFFGFLFRGFGSWNIFIGIFFLILGYLNYILQFDSYVLVPLGFPPQEYFSADYYPLIPWFGYYLIGFGTANWLLRVGKLKKLFGGKLFGGTVFAWLGRHSLLVYVIHVPIIYVVFLMIFGTE